MFYNSKSLHNSNYLVKSEHDSWENSGYTGNKETGLYVM